MKKHVEVGDILKTQPIPGFWVASVVVATQSRTEDFNAMCLVGNTLCVFQHDFAFIELVPATLTIAHGTSGFYADRPILEVYASRLKPDVEVIGSIDLNQIHSQRFTLQFSCQNMPEWPMVGALSRSIGSYAVHEWRSANDHDRWLLDLAEAERSHDAMITRLQQEARAKRQAKKQNKS